MPTSLKTDASSLRLRNIRALIEHLPENAVSYHSCAVADAGWDVKLSKARRTGNFDGVTAPLVLWTLLFYPGYGYVSSKSSRIIFGLNTGYKGAGGSGLAGFLRLPASYFHAMAGMSKAAVLRRLQRRIAWQRSCEARSRRLMKKERNDIY